MDSRRGVLGTALFAAFFFTLVSSCLAESPRRPAVTGGGPEAAAPPDAAVPTPEAGDTPGSAPPGAAASPPETGRLRCAVMPENPRPGEPVTVWVAPSLSTAWEEAGAARQAVLFTAAGKRLSAAPFFAVPQAQGEPPLLAAVLAVPSTSENGFAHIQIGGGGETLIEIPVIIAERTFVSEEIPLNQSLTDIRTVPDPRKTAESQRLWAILSRTGTDIYGSGIFIPPVGSTRRTSFFGDRRVFIYSNGGRDTAIHAGVDYGVPTGTPVAACGPGRVVLASSRIVTGNSVVIEHLPGLYSLYYHLDTIETAEGALVAQGDRIGLSGATGLATGPHLHWEIRVSGENTDPDAFIGRPVLDKDAVLAKISDNTLWNLTVLERR
ncbi:MAG: M23 family metallopeptidase [Treponema sp.]|nr:M23 family metallopeptidase [Treponema sp.]